MNDKIIDRLKKDTNNSSYIIYRDMVIKDTKINIIYNETLTSSDKLSDFVLRSLVSIEKNYDGKIPLYDIVKNNINNIKVKKIKNYDDVCTYLNNGFVILLIEDDYSLALEVKRNLSRSVDKPITETTIRGPLDAFVENIETNIGLIKRRIKSNKLWNEDIEIGRYSKTKVSILTVDGIAEKDIQDKILKILKNIDIDRVIDSGTVKHLIQKETKSIFPTIMTTERPDKVCDALMRGKTVIIVDNSPFALIMPVFLNDFFLSEDDKDAKFMNNSLTRILRYIAFFITIMTPGIYIAITTFNQEMLPLELLTSFASQRSTVPFPAFFEALLMILSFEILRESDLRIPNISNSALSIVGALILGEAAVNAGIVSPIMIIVEATTAISALIITEPELANAIKWYRLFFMIGATTFGMFGVFIVFVFLIINLCSINSFGKPYMIPFAPISVDIKNSFIKFPLKFRNKRDKFLTKNIVREERNEEN